MRSQRKKEPNDCEPKQFPAYIEEHYVLAEEKAWRCLECYDGHGYGYGQFMILVKES